MSADEMDRFESAIQRVVDNYSHVYTTEEMSAILVRRALEILHDGKRTYPLEPYDLVHSYLMKGERLFRNQ